MDEVTQAWIDEVQKAVTRGKDNRLGSVSVPVIALTSLWDSFVAANSALQTRDHEVRALKIERDDLQQDVARFKKAVAQSTEILTAASCGIDSMYVPKEIKNEPEELPPGIATPEQVRAYLARRDRY